VLEDSATGKRTMAVSALHAIAQQIHRRSLVVIFSDMMDNSSRADELFSALQHLRFHKHEVILFHVVDRKKELDLDLEDRPYTFVDMESGEQVKAHPAEVREAYRTAGSRPLAPAQAEMRPVPHRSGGGGHQPGLRADPAGVPGEAGRLY
jgi:hypothetical protein